MWVAWYLVESAVWGIWYEARSYNVFLLVLWSTVGSHPDFSQPELTRLSWCASVSLASGSWVAMIGRLIGLSCKARLLKVPRHKTSKPGLPSPKPSPSHFTGKTVRTSPLLVRRISLQWGAMGSCVVQCEGFHLETPKGGSCRTHDGRGEGWMGEVGEPKV